MVVSPTVESNVRYLYRVSRSRGNTFTTDRAEIAENLNRMLDRESPENLNIRQAATAQLLQLQGKFKPLAMAGAVSFAGALALPAIPSLIIIIVAAVALRILAAAYTTHSKTLEFYSKYYLMRDFYKDVVLSLQSEDEIPARTNECLNKALSKIDDAPHRIIHLLIGN